MRLLLLLCLSASMLGAQMTPAGWAWKTDAPAEPQRGGTGGVGTATFEFTHMAPGWHITMGPGAVLFPERERVAERFALEGEMIYFPDGAADAEYGVFAGGAGLDGMHATWTAFVVRADGQAAVLRHEHGQTRMLLAWTAVTGVAGRDSSGFARHRVLVRAEPDSVRFLVNGARVGAWPRAEIAVDGAMGFRIGRGANLHITNLDVTRRLAPFPPPRR